MTFTQVITRSSLAAIALLNLSLAPHAMAEGQSSTIAEPIVVTRGPNGAAHVVQSDSVPTDAKVVPNHGTGTVSQSAPKAIGGVQPKATSQLIQRGPNGAFFPSN